MPSVVATFFTHGVFTIHTPVPLKTVLKCTSLEGEAFPLTCLQVSLNQGQKTVVPPDIHFKA